MLEDRPYMRSPSSKSNWTSGTTILLIANTVVFSLQAFLGFWNWFPPTKQLDYFGLSIDGLSRGYLWQFLTFQFIHGGFWHLAFNLLAIYFFGRAVEETIGRRAFWKLYFSSGVLGGLLQMVFALLFPRYFGGAVAGASAGAFGLVSAFATMFPHRQITLLIFFVFPVSFQARVFLWLSIVLAVFGILVPSGSIAHAAHLGGILSAVAYIRWFLHREWSFPWPKFKRVKRPRQLVATASAKRSLWHRPKAPPEDDLPPEEFISREVDPILDKISAHGIQSLTERERKILEAARARMAKR